MSTEVEVVDERTGEVTTRAVVKAGSPVGRALITADALAVETEQRKLLGSYVREQMVPDVDYGVIPGTAKRTLYKPGAEKLCSLFYCVPQYTLEDRTEDWDRGLFAYRYTCRIVGRDGSVVAEGVGSCSSYEKKYRWRQAERKCPACGKSAIIKGKAEYGGGWLCFKKKDGCGAKFADDAAEIVSQPAGQTENPEIADMVNTVLKMAKKRSLVDAAISLARCSDLFTQDVEDFSEPEKPAEPAKPAEPEAVIDIAQRNQLVTLIQDTNTNIDDFLKWAGVTALTLLPARKFKAAKSLLEQKKAKVSQ